LSPWKCERLTRTVRRIPGRRPAIWLADLLLVDGDPLAHIQRVDDPARNFVVIMMDSENYKNSLH
jgi:hypothetical protein